MNGLIIAILVIGVGSLTFFIAESLFRIIDRTTETNLERQSDILYTSIENFMMAGEASIAVSFFRDVESTSPDFMVHLFRRDGSVAFSDSATIEEVNARLQRQAFTGTPRLGMEGIKPLMGKFAMSTGMPPQDVIFQSAEGEKVFTRFYKPLLNLPKCTVCHGSDHTVRGVLDIHHDITPFIATQRRAVVFSGVFYLTMVLLIAVILTQFLHRTVIRPVRTIGELCSDVTRGRFDGRIRIGSRDEIGLLGETVNQMVEGLHERYELSKYVSTSTIRSLRGQEGGQESGRKVVLTLLFSDIRGFTSYTENRSPDHVVDSLNRVLNLQTDVIHDHGGDVDKYVGDEVVALFSGDHPELDACRAALEIQRRLKDVQAELDGLQVGIGINCGEVILGRIGSEKRADFTVIGDNVNIASRLCSAAKGGQVVVSASVAECSEGGIETDGPFRLQVKGKAKNLKVFLLTGIRDANRRSTVAGVNA